MYMDDLGHIRWEKQDFKKHGTIAKYTIGECRCHKCKARILKEDKERVMPPRYNSE
jgi:hypothetical protein|tara:strand:+ start:159 stop:326 length:168 start_codon:yes stop_codon:yes gene_type:complete